MAKKTEKDIERRCGVMDVKKCPLCGNEPMAICYTSNPPLYGYSHCSIHGGYNKDWHEAKAKWNEQADTRTKEKGGVEL